MKLYVATHEGINDGVFHFNILGVILREKIDEETIRVVRECRDWIYDNMDKHNKAKYDVVIKSDALEGVVSDSIKFMEYTGDNILDCIEKFKTGTFVIYNVLQHKGGVKVPDDTIKVCLSKEEAIQKIEVSLLLIKEHLKATGFLDKYEFIKVDDGYEMIFHDDADYHMYLRYAAMQVC